MTCGNGHEKQRALPTSRTVPDSDSPNPFSTTSSTNAGHTVEVGFRAPLTNELGEEYSIKPTIGKLHSSGRDALATPESL